MAFGGGFAPAMPCPIHARGDQRDGRRVDQMNRSLELADKSLPGLSADKPWREIAQMFQHRPEEFLGHLGGPDSVRVGQIVAARWRRSSQAGQGAGMQAQRVTYIVEPDTVSQLCIQQGNDMAPRAEGPDFIFNPSLSRQFRNEKVGNEIAYLPQQIQL